MNAEEIIRQLGEADSYKNFIRYMIRLHTEVNTIIGRIHRKHISFGSDGIIYLDKISLCMQSEYELEFWLVKNDPNDPPGYAIYWYTKSDFKYRQRIGLCTFLSEKGVNIILPYLEIIFNHPDELRYDNPDKIKSNNPDKLKDGGVMGFLKQNLKNWHEHSRKKITPQFQDGKDKAGMQGEDFLRKLIVTHQHFGGLKNCLLLTNKRVPKIYEGGKREIDLILLSKKKLHIHEVKNWSGRLEGRIDDPIWIHYPRIGSPREVKNITMDNAEKASVLSQFLNKIGIEVDANEIDYRTFFVDSKRPDGSIRLDISNKISSDKSIVTTDELKGFPAV